MQMIKIAICDDDVKKGKEVEILLDKWMEEKKKCYQKQIFSDSQALLYEIQDGTEFDVLLLDIEMPGLDGMELTYKIKQYLPDALTIFITSHEKYVYESFKVQPFRFIPKKYILRMLSPALQDAVDLFEKCEGKYLYIENQEKVERIPTKSIVYIWHREKYAYVERTNGECTKVRKTLKQLYKELPEEDFLWIDRGCICNLLQISKIDKGDIVLTDGTRHPVSRDRLTEVKARIRKYWIG